MWQLLINAYAALEPFEMDATLDYSSSVFLNSVNRGGFARPTDYTFLLCVHCWRVFEDIRESRDLMKQFLGAGWQRALFSKIIDHLTANQLYGNQMIGDNFCIQDTTWSCSLSTAFSTVSPKTFSKSWLMLPAKQRKVAEWHDNIHCHTVHM